MTGVHIRLNSEMPGVLEVQISKFLYKSAIELCNIDVSDSAMLQNQSESRLCLIVTCINFELGLIIFRSKFHQPYLTLTKRRLYFRFICTWSYKIFELKLNLKS